jgi:hypothetical protein
MPNRTLLALAALSALPLSAAAEPAGNAVVMLLLGQSNGQVASTTNLMPPAAAGPASSYGPPYSSSFTASFSAAPLGPKIFWPLYPGISTRSPSPTSGTMTVSAIASGKVYPGEVVTCSGVASPILVTSDGFGTGHRGGVGTYSVDRQIANGPTACTGAEPDVGGGGALLSGAYIFNCNTLAFEAYDPIPGALQNSNTCAGSAQKGVISKLWGDEIGLLAHYLSANASTTVYVVKGNVGGTALCPSSGSTPAWAPAFAMLAGTKLKLFNVWVQDAYATLAARGVKNYSVQVIRWNQGEHDAQDTAPPTGCNAYGDGGNVYYDNLVDLVDVLTIPKAQNFTATGSISGDLLTITGSPADIIRPGDNLTGPGLPPFGKKTATIVEPYGSTCWNGSAEVVSSGVGAAGTYCIQVEQIFASSGSLTDVTSGATVASGAFRFSGRSARFDATSGAIGVGDVLVGSSLLPGAYVTKLYDYAGGVGNVGINVSLSIPSETLTFKALGWGSGAGGGTGVDQAKVVISEVQSTASGGDSANHQSDGPSRAQEAISGRLFGAVPVTTIQRWDLPLFGLHDAPAVLVEEGRREAAAVAGRCDYTSSTC